MDGFWLEVRKCEDVSLEQQYIKNTLNLLVVASLAQSRAIRCSYGTSKYCSAFIKSVRCSNPECTYLHGLGGDDDSYTKQEIQAGFVTSGRDRAQRIMKGGRIRVGGGGVSGTGKICNGNSVLPPPKYDER